LLLAVLLRLSCSDSLADGGAPKSDENRIYANFGEYPFHALR
jgi:hypothetical protein